MKKNLKLTGIIICSLVLMCQPVEASKSTDGLVSIGQVQNDVSGLMGGWPVLDFISVPSHAIVAIEQEFIRMRTEIENEVKTQIKERLSATKNNIGQQIDTKLSAIEIPSSEANKAVSEGLVGEGVPVDGKSEFKKDAEKTTYDLSIQQQENWTSAAGSLAEKEKYAQKRAYIEQEQAVRLLGTIGVLRKNIQEKLLGEKGVMKQLECNFNKSDAKKDLEPQGGGAVEKTNDYNQVIRQYAFNGLVYDQLLSLEQQILGLRLQAIAGRSAQNISPLSDKLEMSQQSDEAKAEAGK